jgi:nucleoside-diphosphate-sugar epimerase
MRAGVIAVTGATGLVGRHLCDHFRRLGWRVRALVRNLSLYPFNTEGVEVFHCDLPGAVDERAFAGARAIVHCAYMTRFTSLDAAYRVNDLGTREVLELSRSAGVKSFVFLSSQSAHEAARSYYGRSKLTLEKLLDPGRDVIIRSGLVLGKGGSGLFHRMCDMIRKAKVIPVFGGGRQPIQTIHVEDLCRAVEAAVTKGLTGLFTVAEPKALEVRQLLEMIASRLGRRPLFMPLPIPPALAFLRVVEAFGVPFPVSSENLLGLQCLRAVDTTHDLAALGITARSAQESLAEVLDEDSR